MGHLVCHLIDANIDTAFFRSLARCCDREAPVMIGSVAPAGSLQVAMRNLNTQTFSLNINTRWQYPLAILRLVKLIKKEGVKILHAHCFDPTFIGLLSARLARIPFVFTRHHAYHSITQKKPVHTWIDSRCARQADQVIAVSEATKQIMVESERVPTSQITVVYNGIEPLRQPTAESLERVRASIGAKTGHNILMVARLHEEKGHQFLFAALPQIISQVGDVKVLLAGTGPERYKIEDQARKFKVQDNVLFLGYCNDIPELISLASIVVLPSLAESFGFALLEAMSFGKPVVAAATGGIPEVVADGQTGLLVPQANATALAEAICRVLLDKNLAQSFGEAGRQRAGKFTFEKMIRDYESIYERVL